MNDKSFCREKSMCYEMEFERERFWAAVNRGSVATDVQGGSRSRSDDCGGFERSRQKRLFAKRSQFSRALATGVSHPNAAYLRLFALVFFNGKVRGILRRCKNFFSDRKKPMTFLPNEPKLNPTLLTGCGPVTRSKPR
jgi:hypothetical protein